VCAYALRMHCESAVARNRCNAMGSRSVRVTHSSTLRMQTSYTTTICMSLGTVALQRFRRTAHLRVPATMAGRRGLRDKLRQHAQTVRRVAVTAEVSEFRLSVRSDREPLRCNGFERPLRKRCIATVSRHGVFEMVRRLTIGPYVT